jgi:histone H3/H4
MGEVLVVTSKVKAFVKSTADMNTSGTFVDALSGHVQALCRKAIENARADGRKTVKDRDLDTGSNGSNGGF